MSTAIDFLHQLEDVPFESKAVTIDPERAENILTHYLFPWQRTRRPKNVQRYARAMNRGEWQFGGEIHVAVVEGKPYLINGQHRIAAIILSGITLSFTAIIYHCENMEQAKRLYYVMDAPVVRDKSVALDVMEMTENIGVGKTVLRRAAAALRIIEGNFTNNSLAMTPDETLSLLCEWRSEIVAWNEAVGNSRSASHASTSPVMSVGLVTMRYQREKAMEFWRRIGRLTDLADGTPEHLLAQFINGEEGSRPNRQGVAKTGVSIYSRKVAVAWNAYFNGVTQKQLLRVHDAGKPILIAGTPYKG